MPKGASARNLGTSECSLVEVAQRSMGFSSGLRHSQGASIFLTVFMVVAFVALNPRSEHVDSFAALKIREAGDKELAKAVGTAVFPVMNFTLSDGSPVAKNWVDMPWARKFHMGAVPVLTWLLVAPIQLSSSLRKRFPYLHRSLGYAFFLASACLSFGLLLIVISGRVYGYPWIVGFLLNVFKLSYFMLSLAKSLYFAKRRNLQLHQKWVTRHLAMGYTLSVQRVLLLGFGPLLQVAGVLKVVSNNGVQIWYTITSVLSTAPSLYVEACLNASAKDSMQSVQREKGDKQM